MEDNVEKVKVPITWDFSGPDKAEPGDLVTFELVAHDTKGNIFDIQTGQLSGTLSLHDKARGLCEEKGRVRKAGVGTFVISFVPRLIGKQTLNLQNGNLTLFKNQQITLEVMNELPDVTWSYDFELEGKGLRNAKVNDTVTLTILVNEHGKLADLPKLLKVKIFGNGKTSMPQVYHLGTGTYCADFQSREPGIFSATVIYEDSKVLKQRIEFFEPPSPFHSRVCDLPATIPVNQPKTIILQSLDTGGNLISCGGAKWAIHIKHLSKELSGTLPLKLTDQKNGDYIVEFTLPVEGPYQIDISVNGKAIRKSPFKIKAT
jgi:hypothetical protein